MPRWMKVFSDCMQYKQALQPAIYSSGKTMRAILLAASIIFSATACTTVKDWSATGGSKSDGVVRLSHEVGEFETVQLSEVQAVGLATQRCASWGYTGAEAFGGTTKQCSQPGGLGGCAMWVVTKEYQCTENSTRATETPAQTETYVLPSQRKSLKK